MVLQFFRSQMQTFAQLVKHTVWAMQHRIFAKLTQ